MWWIAYYADGRRRRESSGIRLDQKLGYKRALDVARQRSQAEKAKDGTGPEWDPWVTGWLELKFGSPEKARSLAIEKHRWRWVHAFLLERKIIHPAQVTYQSGLDFLTWRQEHKTRSGKGGFNNALGDLHLFARVMRAAVQRELITASPLERMGIKRQKSPEKPEIIDTEIAAIRAGLKEREAELPITERWMTVSFEIALHQGCRLMETSVAMADVDEERGTILFRQKGDRPHITRLHEGWAGIREELRFARAERTCVMPNPKMAAKEWHWFLKGRREKDRNVPGVAPRICFHCTRVTVITRLARAGVPISEAMRYVGHADQAIHRIYQRLTAPDLGSCTQAISYGASAPPQSQDGALARPEGPQRRRSSGSGR